MADPGFDHSLLCEFRGRLLGGNATKHLLTRVLDAAREGGLLKARGRQRTDSTHVLAAVRELNRIELLAETLRAALNAITAAAPEWLRALAHLEWHKRYGRRIEETRLPKTGPKCDAYVVQVGADGYRLLDALAEEDAPAELTALPAVAVLRRVWARHFGREDRGTDSRTPPAIQLRPVEGHGPGDRIESPYDADARYRSKSGMSWTDYMVHLTETCDTGALHLVLHAESEHLVDSAYISADHLIRAREQHNIDLIGPGRPRTGWQARIEDAYSSEDFTLDWEGQVIRCPQSRTSTSWRGYHDKTSGPYIRARFSAAGCNPCPAKPRCTRGRDQGRQLTLRHASNTERSRPHGRGDTEQGRRLYAQRQGIEGTISQGVRSFGLRRARYRGLAKTGLQGVATAAAINLDRLAAWFAQRLLAPTRVPRFAAIAA